MLDFDNDALRPLVGELVTIDGCLRGGRTYLSGTLVRVLTALDGAYIEVHENYTDEVFVLHAFQEAHRVRVCG